jgi:hypothetical protein
MINAAALPGGMQENLQRLTEKTPLVQNIVGGGSDAVNFWSDEEKAQAGLPLDAAVYTNSKGEPKILDPGKEQRASQKVINQTNDALTQYKAKLDQYGAKFIPGADTAELESAYANLMLEAKELYNLGVLQKADMEVINAVMEDPTSMKAQLYGKEGLKGQLQIFETKIEDAKKRHAEQFGAEAAPGAPAWATSGNRVK